MSHENYKEMLPLYSLGVLEEAEARALKEHLTDLRGVSCRTGPVARHRLGTGLRRRTRRTFSRIAFAHTGERQFVKSAARDK